MVWGGSALNKNTILFERLGTTSASSTFGHMTVDLNYEVFENKSIEVREFVKQSHRMISQLRQKNGMKPSRMSDDMGPVVASVSHHIQRLCFYGKLFGIGQPGRQKRQAGLLAGAGMLLNFGISAYSLVELEEIKSNVDVMEDNVKFIATALDKTELKVSHLDNKISKMEEIIEKVVIEEDEWRMEALTSQMYANVTRTVALYEGEMHDYYETLSLLMRRRLNPTIVKRSCIQRAFDELTAKARVHGLEPIVDHPSLIFNSDTSTLITKQGHILAIIHVPLKHGPDMEILKFVSIPLQINDLYMEVNAKEDLLIIDQAETMVKTARAVDLESCVRLGNYYHCEDSNVLQRDVGNECLFNLYKGDSEAVKKNCDLTLRPARNTVVQVSRSSFHLLAPNHPEPLDIACGSQLKKMIIKGYQQVNLTAGCRGSFDNFILVNDVSISAKKFFVEFPLQIEVSQFMLTNDTEEVHAMLRDLNANNDAISLSQVEGHLRQMRWRATVWYIVGSVFSAMIILVVTALLYRRLHRLVCRRQEPSPDEGQEGPAVELYERMGN